MMIAMVYLDGGDTDHDGIHNACDNCPNLYNPLQLDADHDGLGDVCDPTPGCGGCGQPACEQPPVDSDNDSMADVVDNCPNVYNPLQLDADHDGLGDVCDPTPGCGGCGQPACELQFRKPTVFIYAVPIAIKNGEQAMLSWSSSDADSCTMQPGIGVVGREGSVPVSPSDTTAYTITAAGPGGKASSAVSVMVTAHLLITSPLLEGSHIERPDTLVQGTINEMRLPAMISEWLLMAWSRMYIKWSVCSQPCALRNGDNSTITASCI